MAGPVLAPVARLLARRWGRQPLPLAAALAHGLLAPWLLDGPWTLLLADALAVTLLAVLLPQRRETVPAPTGSGELPLGWALLGPGLALAALLGPRLAGGGALASTPAVDRAAAVAVLATWGGMVLVGAEWLVRGWGSGPRTLLGTALPALTLLAAPLTLQPLFPWAIRPALLLCPVVGAARALGLEVIHQPVLYDLTNLDDLEFHYPAWYLAVLSFGALAVLFGAAAWRQCKRR